MKSRYAIFAFLLLSLTITIAQAQNKCFDDYGDQFKSRGAYEITDGLQKIVVALKDKSNKSSCFEGEVLVKGNTIMLPVYIKRENGSYTVAKSGLDKMFYRESQGDISYTVKDGMSPIYMIEGGRQARLFFIDYLKPNPGGPVTAPEIVKKESAPKKEDLDKISNSSKSIQFETGKDVIKPESYAQLDAIVELIKAYPDSKWSISGYTDNTGKDDKNRLLSLKRAEAVETYFVSKGVNPAILFASGMGSKNPIADNSTEEGRKTNRRVEIKPII